MPFPLPHQATLVPLTDVLEEPGLVPLRIVPDLIPLVPTTDATLSLETVSNPLNQHV